MRIPLQEYFDDWNQEFKNSPLFAIKAAESQIMKIRDSISPLVWSGIDYRDLPNEAGKRSDCKVSADVIAEHRSKSVRLPVYQFRRPDVGFDLTMRGNFSDWKISVRSDRPIHHPLFPDLFDTDPKQGELSSCYFEGFPRV